MCITAWSSRSIYTDVTSVPLRPQLASSEPEQQSWLCNGYMERRREEKPTLLCFELAAWKVLLFTLNQKKTRQLGWNSKTFSIWSVWPSTLFCCCCVTCWWPNQTTHLLTTAFPDCLRVTHRLTATLGCLYAGAYLLGAFISICGKLTPEL